MKQRLGGQALGWLQDAAAMPGRPRRVACTTEGRQRVADTRRQASKPVGHGDWPFSENKRDSVFIDDD